MTVSTMLDLGGYSNDDDARRLSTGIASVRVLGIANALAACSCGWSGGRRFLRAAAEQDAWTHALRESCTVSCPLVTTR